MYGLTRGAITLVGVLVAGFLIWAGVDPLMDDGDKAEFWWAVLLLALAGFAIALSQLLGGWTKWGWPRISGNVFLIAFVPALIAGGWVLLFTQPGDGWLGGDVRNWTSDMGLRSLVEHFALAWFAVAFTLGLVFGLTFDTTGPIVRRRRGEAVPAPGAVPPDEATDDDRRVRIKEGDAHSD